MTHNRKKESDYFFKVGDRVRVPVSGWTGTVIKVRVGNSTPYVVRWDKNGLEGPVHPINMELMER